MLPGASGGWVGEGSTHERIHAVHTGTSGSTLGDAPESVRFNGASLHHGASVLPPPPTATAGGRVGEFFVPLPLPPLTGGKLGGQLELVLQPGLRGASKPRLRWQPRGVLTPHSRTPWCRSRSSGLQQSAAHPLKLPPSPCRTRSAAAPLQPHLERVPPLSPTQAPPAPHHAQPTSRARTHLQPLGHLGFQPQPSLLEITLYTTSK